MTIVAVAVAAGCVLYLLLKQQKHYTDRSLLLRNLMVERTQWRRQLRYEVAEFCALASSYYYSVYEQEEDYTKKAFAHHVKRMDELRVRVRLRLNPNETIDSNDTKLIRSMARVVLHFETRQYDNLHRELLRIERCAQRILKSEWDKSKREAQRGKIERRIGTMD
ncbi:hypothetical protein [Vibrio sp.]|uniref:hypothetical protein n=1 Tax=Vibrio sp. TaxID=678 RepID=UPI003D0A08EE